MPAEGLRAGITPLLHFADGHVEDMLKTFTLALAALALAAPSAAARETLTVYTYDSFVSDWGPGAAIKTEFEKTCGCEVKWVTLGDGVAMLNRLKLEGRETSADVVLGLDTNLTAEAKDLGLFGAHGIDVSKVRVPGGWSDDTFVPYDYAHFAVVYDTAKMTAAPKSLDELVNGDSAQKIVLEDPRSSTPGLGFLLWMKAVYGADAAAKWTKLKPRILTTTPGWSEAYALFTKGEAAMVLSYTTSPAYHMVEEKTARYQAAPFAEGHYLQVEVAGLIAASPERELARKFLAFMLTPGFQNEIPTRNWMLPAGETSVALPEAFSKLVTPTKTLAFSPEEVRDHHREWIGEWLNATQ